MYIFTYIIASTATSVPAHRQHVNEVAAAICVCHCDLQELNNCTSVLYSFLPLSLNVIYNPNVIRMGNIKRRIAIITTYGASC